MARWRHLTHRRLRLRYQELQLVKEWDGELEGFTAIGLREKAKTLPILDSTLRFIERARRLGFSLKQVAELLTLWRDRHRASSDVRRLAETQIRRVDARLSELQDMRRSLQHLMERCHGDERPDCPILEELAGQG